MAQDKKTQEETDFFCKLKSILVQEKQRIQPKIDEAERLKKRQQEVNEAHRRLRESQRQDTENIRAAGVILKWVIDFTTSEDYGALKELIVIRGNEKSWFFLSDAVVRISAIISEQRLFVAVEDTRLTVANCFKYGRSYKLNSVAEILEQVKPEVIREVARTIEKGEIEDIILVENN